MGKEGLYLEDHEDQMSLHRPDHEDMTYNQVSRATRPVCVGYVETPCTFRPGHTSTTPRTIFTSTRNLHGLTDSEERTSQMMFIKMDLT